MRRHLLLLSLAVMSNAARAADPPQMPTPTKEHEWLKQFVGEWESKTEASMGPGLPPVQCQGQMRSRMLGGFWLVSESEADWMGDKITAVQTIGYDPKTKQYVGTWVDSATDYLWRYTGSVDETGKVLTLEAEGPNFLEPGKTGKFRDAYEIKSADHIVATSSLLGPDGKWIVFMTGQVTRMK